MHVQLEVKHLRENEKTILSVTLRTFNDHNDERLATSDNLHQLLKCF